jgi:hypothetical protein
MESTLAALAATHADPSAARAGYGVALTDIAAFEQALERARSAAANGTPTAPVTVTAPPHAGRAGESMQALFRPLEQIDGQAASLAAQARAATAEGRALTPSELLRLTVQCHQFMFHCQLTANVANRTSDGLQQLFRQQS